MPSDLLTLAKDVETIAKAETSSITPLSMKLSWTTFTNLDSFPIFKGFIQVPKDKMTLLEAPILQGQALDKALQIEVDELQKAKIN